MLLEDCGGRILRRDDGGVWRLDGPRWLREHVGRRVVVTGVRTGFDRMEVEALDGFALRRPWIMSWEVGVGVLFTLSSLAGMLVGMSQN